MSIRILKEREIRALIDPRGALGGRGAPYPPPVRRFDNSRAAKQFDVVWKLPAGE